MNYMVNISAKSRVWMVIGMAGVLLISGMVTGIAYAVTDPTDITISPGVLNMSAVTVGNFAGVTLNLTAQTDTATMTPFSVTDARGTGAGWNVTVQATQFAEHNGTAYVGGGRTLALSSLSMTAPSVVANGTSSPVPTMTAGPYVIDSGSAVKIASAAVGNGRGAYNFTPGADSITLSIPADAYAATYRSEVTVSTVSGP